MTPWSDRVKITISICIAVSVIAAIIGITVGALDYNEKMNKATIACNEAPGKQWVADQCLVVN